MRRAVNGPLLGSRRRSTAIASSDDHKGGLNFLPAILIQVSGNEREDDAKLIEGD
jgi:hypothetical protein